MMNYSRVQIASIGYELAPVVVTSAELEQRLEPLYQKLRMQPGQLQALTGIGERRWWLPGTSLAEKAAAAGRKALSKAGLTPQDLGSLVYAGVCRESFEPATACRVADALGLQGQALVYDLSNACLGILNGMLEIANRIELGQIDAGMVVSCESSREIMELTIQRLLEQPDMPHFSASLATLTGGSGAVAVVLTAQNGHSNGHRLLGGVALAEPEHHELCRWGIEPNDSGLHRQYMQTDAVAVMKNGVELGRRTWAVFLETLNWSAEGIDRVICHQVGEAHQKTVLQTMGISEDKDFVTFPFLGNIGTVSLPITAAIAAERGAIRSGDRVGFLGIGSGLNCMMLGVEW